jgi:hypothetical protein
MAVFRGVPTQFFGKSDLGATEFLSACKPHSFLVRISLKDQLRLMRVSLFKDFARGRALFTGRFRVEYGTVFLWGWKPDLTLFKGSREYEELL